MARFSLFLVVLLLALSTLFVCVSARRHRRRSENDGNRNENVDSVEKKLEVTEHKYLTAQEEATLESIALFKIKRSYNDGVLKALTKDGEFLFQEGVDTKDLVVVSVGSTTTQIYDGAELSESFAVGCGVGDAGEAKKLWKAIQDGKYMKVLMINAIGYVGTDKDPALFAFDEMANRISLLSSPDRYAGIDSLSTAFAEIFDDSEPTSLDSLEPAKPVETATKPLVLVHNRVKKSGGYLFPQLDNTFTDGLFAKYSGFAAIVDWGGQSIKVYVEQKGASPGDPSKAVRKAEQSLDSNKLLCQGGKVDTELVKAIDDSLVLELVRKAEITGGSVLVAQTGLARELYNKGKSSQMDYASHLGMLDDGKTPCDVAQVNADVFDCSSMGAG